MGYVEDVSPGWEQRRKWKCFLVSFWGSIISPHAIQGVPGSLPVFCEQLLLFALLLQCERVSMGLALGVSLERRAEKSGVLIKKVSGGIWLAHRCPHELIPQKGSRSKYYVNFSGISCAGSQTEKLIWSFFCSKSVSCMIFVSWPLISCIYIVTDPLFQCFENTRLWGKWALNKASTHVGWSTTAVQ